MGTMISKDGNDKGKITKIDSNFARAMYNGLIYAETFQSLSYIRNKPVVLAEYVPGHQAKFTRVEYVKDDQLDFPGVTISVKVIKATVNNNILYYWLNSKGQELIKIEAVFPGFTYRLLRTV